MAIVLKGALADPLSLDVAGPSILFLIGCIPLYSLVLFLYETNFFRCKFGARGAVQGNEV